MSEAQTVRVVAGQENLPSFNVYNRNAHLTQNTVEFGFFLFENLTFEETFHNQTTVLESFHTCSCIPANSFLFFQLENVDAAKQSGGDWLGCLEESRQTKRVY